MTTYNRLGFATQTNDPDMGTWSYTYYDDGLLKRRTDARLAYVDHTYDSLGRITSKVYGGTPALPNVTYTYDTCQVSCINDRPVGRLTKVTFGGATGGNRAYGHDNRGRVYKEILNLNDLGWVLEHSYDSMDRETCLKYPDGEYVTTAFDAQGAVESVAGNTTSCTAAGTTTCLSSTDYNAAGLPTRNVLGNGLYVDYGYRATDLKPTFIFASFPPAPALVNYGYGWDAGGKNINLITDATTNPATNLSMTYDHLDRLDTVTGWSQLMDFDYNEIGNMTKKVETDQPAKNYDIMSYGEGAPGPHAITTADPASGANHVFTYDANGSMLSETNGSTVHSFQYDADGMVSYRNTPAEDQAYYYYDPDGVLVRKAPDTIAFGTGYLGEVYENNITQGEVTKYYFAGGARVAMRKGASLYYLAQDHLSGTAVITDPAKQMTGRIRYYPYGGTRTTDGTIPTDKLFTGQQRETANGIYHYNARMYNTDIGRMPQGEIIVAHGMQPQAYNRYSYVMNNPVSWSDPTGLAPQLPRVYGPTNRMYESNHKLCSLNGVTCAKIKNTLVVSYFWDTFGFEQTNWCWVKTKRTWNNPFKVPFVRYFQVFVDAAGAGSSPRMYAPADAYEDLNRGLHNVAQEDMYYGMECRSAWSSSPCIIYGSKWRVAPALSGLYRERFTTQCL